MTFLLCESWGAGCLSNRAAKVKPPCPRMCRALGLVEPLLLHGCLLGGCCAETLARRWLHKYVDHGLAVVSIVDGVRVLTRVTGYQAK
jgi:hypothetical protein